MNDVEALPTDPRAAADRIAEYLDRLEAEPELLSRLEDAVAGIGDTSLAMQELQQSLGSNTDPGDATPAWGSVPARLRLNWAGKPRRGDRGLELAVHSDVRGHTRVITTPPLNRAFMHTRPWQTNPFARSWAGFKSLLFGRRGQMSTRDEVQPDSPDPKGRWRFAATRRRLVLVGFIIAQTYLATYLMTAILPYHGQHWLEMLILAIYAILFAWVGAGFWTALMGFWVLLLGRDKYSISATAAADTPIDPKTKTAILVPICNEDVPRVMAGLRATYNSVVRTGKQDAFDFFILSDSNDTDTRVAELRAWLELCREVDGFGRIFYRRRTHRIKRKSGNVADWCRRWGSNYKYMIVLDADSVMSGGCLVRLVQLMEANPNAGIIQTAPRAAGRETLYARIQQFATRVYGPLFTAGLHFWQLGESHYWGHNAILRVAPFMRHCSLARLPGDGGLSGEILSHDFVEAALMRRAGWSVWIAYDLPGSWEEMPPTLLDELKRDRRWCQGNLQNFQLFLAQGLHPAHRAVFMTGVMAYLSAPLWFLFLVLSTALLAVNVLTEPVYFSEPYQLFPTWPEWHPEWAVRLFGATATLLFLPKILAACVVLAKPSEWKGFGGPVAIVGSVLAETLFSALLAPIRMLFHTTFVTAALLGVSITWKSPPREDAETTWSEALQKHGTGSLLGIVWAAGVYWLNPEFLWWLLPVVGALALAIPMSVYSSRVSLGRAAHRLRLFLFPEESIPPRELRWTRMAAKRMQSWVVDFRDAVVDPRINALVAASVTPRERVPRRSAEQRKSLVETALSQGPDALNASQRNLLLTDPIALSRLHYRLWSVRGAHPAWLQTPPPSAAD
jgi:membrane glycosyltransferase